MLAFQDESWADDSPVPTLAPIVQETVDKILKATVGMLKKTTIVRVLQQAGAEEYWQDFHKNLLQDREALGDGARFYRAGFRKLHRAATKTPPVVSGAGVVRKEEPLPFIRQKICAGLQSSFMPKDGIPIKAGSLVAVYLDDARCKELSLWEFRHYEPLIGKVRTVVDSTTFECAWLEAQAPRGQPCVDGLTDGYAGRWTPWRLPSGELAPTTVLSIADTYASNFQLMPTDQLCMPLRAAIKQALVNRQNAARQGHAE